MSKEWTTTFGGNHQSNLAVRAGMMMVASLVILAALQSSALVTWSYDLPNSWYSELISRSVEQWHAVMEKVGIASLSQSISDAVQSLHDDWPVSE